jgi:hypothetical protein
MRAHDSQAEPSYKMCQAGCATGMNITEAPGTFDGAAIHWIAPCSLCGATFGVQPGSATGGVTYSFLNNGTSNATDEQLGVGSGVSQQQWPNQGTYAVQDSGYGTTGYNTWTLTVGAAATPGPVVANPDPVNIIGTGAQQTVTFTEANYSGSFVIKQSPNSAVATLGNISGNTVTVTSTGYGQTNFYVAGGNPTYTNVVVNVSPSPGPVVPNPTSLTFQGVQQSKTITVSEANYSGPFSASVLDTSKATVSVSGNTVNVLSIAPGSTSVAITGAAGHSVNVPISVPTPGVVDIFPNDTLYYPKSGNKIPPCTWDQPYDPTQANQIDPDAAFVPDVANGFNGNGCEIINATGKPVDQMLHWSVHVHETGFYGAFNYKVGSGCGTSLSGIEISSATGPDAMVKMHGTGTVSGPPVTCLVTITGWKDNALSNVQVTVKVGTSPP